MILAFYFTHKKSIQTDADSSLSRCNAIRRYIFLLDKQHDVRCNNVKNIEPLPSPIHTLH